METATRFHLVTSSAPKDLPFDEVLRVFEQTLTDLHTLRACYVPSQAALQCSMNTANAASAQSEPLALFSPINNSGFRCSAYRPGFISGIPYIPPSSGLHWSRFASLDTSSAQPAILQSQGIAIACPTVLGVRIPTRSYASYASCIPPTSTASQNLPVVASSSQKLDQSTAETSAKVCSAESAEQSTTTNTTVAEVSDQLLMLQMQQTESNRLTKSAPGTPCTSPDSNKRSRSVAMDDERETSNSRTCTSVNSTNSSCDSERKCSSTASSSHRGPIKEAVARLRSIFPERSEKQLLCDLKVFRATKLSDQQSAKLTIDELVAAVASMIRQT